MRATWEGVGEEKGAGGEVADLVRAAEGCLWRIFDRNSGSRAFEGVAEVFSHAMLQ